MEQEILLLGEGFGYYSELVQNGRCARSVAQSGGRSWNTT
jgi:hypothetical protein